MAITLPGGFNITNVDPVDDRITVSNESARLGFSSANVYEGLIVYQQDNNKLFVLVDTGSWNSTSGWTEVGSGTSGSATIDTGSFYVSSSITNNVITFDQGDGTTDTITIPSGGINTGSFLISASISSSTENVITFTKGNNSTFNITLITSSFYVSSSVSGSELSIFKGDGVEDIISLPGGGDSIFTLTGSYYSTTNNLKITGSLDINAGQESVTIKNDTDTGVTLKVGEPNSGQFTVKNSGEVQLNPSGSLPFTAFEGGLIYSASNLYLGVE